VVHVFGRWGTSLLPGRIGFGKYSLATRDCYRLQPLLRNSKTEGMTELSNATRPFRTIDAIHHKKYKPSVIDWLTKRFNLPPYAHSYKDQWIRVNIWDGSLSIGFDNRQPEQIQLFNSIPDEFKGCLQYGTGILVNKDSLYFYFDKEWQVEYPAITGSKIIKETKHVDNDGDDFYVYEQLINLSDGTQIIYSNQSKQLDISGYSFRTLIQERFFYQLITSQP
jgi:hypothetical protein